MQVKLLPTAEQAASLLKTMEQFNAACDTLAAIAFSNKCANKVELQKIAYHGIRADFGLSAQMTVRAIAKVVEVYKRDKSIQPSFRPHGAIVYDERILSWKGSDRVSVLTVDGREIMPWVAGAYQHARLDRVRGQADLIYRDGQFFLYVTIDVGDVPPGDPTEYLGVDLGRKNIAADNDGETFSGAHIANLRNRHARLRRKLQKKGTKSAKRLLKRRRAKESRFARDVNHRISKAIVRKAKDTGRGIALEDLKGIRARTTVRRSQRRAHHSWSFHQLRAFLTYKAAMEGVPLVCVDPRNTSRECPCCGMIDKRNRPDRDTFRCIQCGHAGPADTTAAVNISRRGSRHAAERRAA
ncbi:RNA-guided endonuclease InsQ/TnpB family protein [Rhodovastum atsumiense]|nr:RNA-guided endonuclease TnpB family protein [Rhodovastum atsumiense]